MIELIDIKLTKHLQSIYSNSFLYSIHEDNDIPKWKELSEKRGFELDFPIGAFNREQTQYDRQRFNLPNKKYGQPGLARANYDRTIGSTTKFVPIDINYKIRLYSDTFAEMVNFERYTWFDLQDSTMDIVYPVYNSRHTYTVPLTVEDFSAPEEAQPFRRSRTYRINFTINIKAWVIKIRDVRLVHQIIAEMINDARSDNIEESLVEFYYGERIWD